MPRLKNRQQGIPGGFSFIQPESGWDTEKIPGVKGRSFSVVSQALLAHRKGNPWLAKKHNWALDLAAVEDELDFYNALRLQQNPKWHHFIDEGGGSSASGPFHFPRPIALARAVAGSVKKTVAGVGVLLRWLGASGRSVEKPLAEIRAGTCAICPKNQPGDWKTWFTEEASREILLIFGMMQDLKLATSKDGQLGVCSACLCPLRSKVWTELRHIAAELTPQVKAELNQEAPLCWILSELKQIK